MISVSYASSVHKSTRCKDIPLNPILRGGHKPLAQFFEDATLPEDQRDCWVYEDSTGKNKIIAPLSWGATPDDFNLPYVSATFKAMEDSRKFFKTFAQAKDDYFIIISEQRPDLAQAFWTQSFQCFVEASYNYIQAVSTEYWQQTVAHELSHCLIMENIPSLSPANYQVEEDAWWDESASEWLSTLVYPKSDLEIPYAQAFDLDGATFMQPYKGFLVFSHHAMKNGLPQTFAIVKNMNSYPTRAGQLSYLRNKGLTEFFLDFYMSHHESKVINLPASRYTIESEVLNHPQSPIEIPSDVSPFSFDLMDLKNARANIIEVKVPKGYEMRIRPLQDQKDVSLGLRESGGSWSVLDKPVPISSTCEKEATFSLMLVHLYELNLPRVTVEYKLTELEDCQCNLDEPVIDKCLQGTWSLDFDKVEALIRSRAQGQPVRIDEVLGLETLIFGPNGESSINHNWTIQGTSTHTANSTDTVELSWQGQSSARYSTLRQSILCGQQLSHQSSGTMTYTTQGQSYTFPMNSATGPIAPLQEGDVTYTCSGDKLEMVNRHDGDEFTFYYDRVSY